MKRRIISLLSLTVMTALLGTSSVLAQPNFCDVSIADMLLVTHASLRTPNWVPGMAGAWETRLLQQKGALGIDVAVYNVTDGTAASTIRTYVQNNGPQLRYVFIVGDDDHLDVNADAPVWPTALASANRFVPLYGDTLPAQVCGVDHYAVENDYGYVEGRSYLTIGRLPASSSNQISAYLTKCSTYVYAGTPAWARKQLLAFDDSPYRFWTGCYGPAVLDWAEELSNMLPQSWTNTKLS